jgi:aldehyde dehydrogenase (NAD+)
VDPSTGAIWTNVSQATASDVERAVTAASRALESWRTTGLPTRQKTLLAIADAIESRADEWDTLLPIENGRPRREVAIGDIPSAAGILRYFGGIVRDHGGRTIATEDGLSHVYTVCEPIGVVAAVIPWNSPLITTAQKVALAIAAGNTVVVKPSEFASPSVVEFILGLSHILRPGVVNVVPGFGSEVGSAPVSHPGISKISFRGGTDTATRILAQAAPTLTPSLMELGGKSSFLISRTLTSTPPSRTQR